MRFSAAADTIPHAFPMRRQANALLEDLCARSFAPAHREHAELEKFAGWSTHGCTNPLSQNWLNPKLAQPKIDGSGRKLATWDINYYAEKLKTQRYSYDEEEVRQYLSLYAVLGGLFGVVSRLFGVTVVERAPADVGAQVCRSCR